MLTCTAGRAACHGRARPAACSSSSRCSSSSTALPAPWRQALLGSRPQQAGLPQPCRRARQQAGGTAITASAAAAAGLPADGSSDPQPVQAQDQGKASFLEAFWKFLRPHTIRGTILGATAVTARALLENQHLIDWGLLPRALLGVLALLCGNGYIVGINQVYDVDIDTVNKPFLPVAAGELSPQLATGLCAALAVGGCALVLANFDRLIASLYAFGLLLGTLYSVPPLRLKRFAVPAFMIIATVRGFLLNFGVYYATRAALQLPFQWSPAISFITCFVTLFAVVIAITKDLPDVEGDRQFGISTLATRLGERKVTFLASGLLLLNYVGAAVLALWIAPGSFRMPLMVGAHALLGAGLVAATARLDAAKYTPGAISDYYRSVWNLFYAEYALFPFL